MCVGKHRDKEQRVCGGVRSELHIVHAWRWVWRVVAGDEYRLHFRSGANRGGGERTKTARGRRFDLVGRAATVPVSADCGHGMAGPISPEFLRPRSVAGNSGLGLFAMDV